MFSRRSCSSAQLSRAAPPASLQLCRREPSFTHTLLKLPWLRSRVGTVIGASGGVLSEGLRADDSGRSCGESTEGCRIASGTNEEPADLAGGSSHSNESLRGASGGGGGFFAGVLLFRPNILHNPTQKFFTHTDSCPTQRLTRIGRRTRILRLQAKLKTVN